MAEATDTKTVEKQPSAIADDEALDEVLGEEIELVSLEVPVVKQVVDD